jgi:AmmeMemoRadiSam system protein A
MLSLADRHTLLNIARQTLNLFLTKGALPDLHTESAGLLEPRASFITLRVRETGELRGCRGETQARRPLIESVAHMSIASATDDPRFPSVQAAEIPHLHIEINALTPLAPIQPQDIEIGRHGLMIVKEVFAGLLLPEVATRYHWDVDTFLRAICRKAGLPENAWAAQDARLFGFEAEVWEEE